MTTHELDGDTATLLMRALLGRTISADEVQRVGWERLAAIARQNGILLRVAGCIEAGRLTMPALVDHAVASERQRAAAALGIVRRVSEICAAHGVPFLFPKALQHHPDMGSDLDLLVGTRSTAIDDALVRELGGTAVRPNLVSRIAGTATYSIPGGPPLDIQHGRLGAVGEHVAFPAALLAHSRPCIIDGVTFLVPSADDQLVLQGMQRVYGRRRIRLSDIIYTVSTITGDSLDWDYIVAQARLAGILRGLSCYVSYVDQVHLELMGYPLLDAPVAARLSLAGWGRLEFRGGFYRYPVVRVSARVYPPILSAQLRGGNWSAAGRLCLVPFLGMASAIRYRAGLSARANA